MPSSLTGVEAAPPRRATPPLETAAIWPTVKHRVPKSTANARRGFAGGRRHVSSTDAAHARPLRNPGVAGAGLRSTLWRSRPSKLNEVLLTEYHRLHEKERVFPPQMPRIVPAAESSVPAPKDVRPITSATAPWSRRPDNGGWLRPWLGAVLRQNRAPRIASLPGSENGGGSPAPPSDRAGKPYWPADVCAYRHGPLVPPVSPFCKSSRARS